MKPKPKAKKQPKPDVNQMAFGITQTIIGKSEENSRQTAQSHQDQPQEPNYTQTAD